ncbi:MAG: hypothetical protein R3E95_22330 [Thiolinea sp.]
MNHAELMQMIADHYQGEAQLLTSGAEENLLKLAELRGNMTETQQARWEQIKEEYRRNRLARKADVEIGLEIAEKLGEISLAFKHSDQVLETSSASSCNAGETCGQTPAPYPAVHSCHDAATSTGATNRASGEPASTG